MILRELFLAIAGLVDLAFTIYIFILIETIIVFIAVVVDFTDLLVYERSLVEYAYL